MTMSGGQLVLDGRMLASEIKAQLASEIRILNRRVGLGTILVGSDPSSHSYVAGKHRDCAEVGIQSIQIELPDNANEEEILAAVSQLNNDRDCTGFIVQLPLPKGVDANKVLERVSPSKDADGLHPLNLGKLVLQQEAPRPCTPEAIFELVSRNGISWDGKEVVVLGRGTTVGRPLGLMLSGRSVNATVTLTHTGTRNLTSHTKRADIVIAALGKPHFLTEEMIKEGAVVIDVGLTRVDGKLIGDVDPSIYKKTSAYSPAPGGIGPMTRAMLLKNVVGLAHKDVN